MEKMYLVFLIFNDNLFAVNQPPSFSSSSFTLEKSVLISRCEWKRFVSLANIIRSKIFDAFWRSLTSIRNNKGPSIESYGTPHAILLKVVHCCCCN